MVLAVGATAVHPRLAIELAAELAGTRGAEDDDRRPRPIERARHRLRGRPAQDPRPDGDQRGRVVHRRGPGRRRRPRSRRSSRDASRRRRHGPAARRFADLAERQLRRRAAALAIPEPAGRPRAAPARPRVRPVPRRRRGAPLLAAGSPARSSLLAVGGPDRHRDAATSTRALARTARRSPGPPTDRSVPRDELRDPPRRERRSPLADVEDARSIVRRFVVSAMSVGALSPEAHQALTIGIQRAGGSANTGEGGEDPAWYEPGRRRPPPRRPDQAGRLGSVRGDRHLPGPGRPARDQDRPGLEARRGRPAPGPEGHGLHRGAASRAARPELHQPAAAPRHLLDRGPGPADRRPAGDQPARPDRGQARRRPRRRARSPRASPRPAPRTSTCRATPAGPARRRCRRSSTSARRGSSVWPRSTRSCCATTCATGSRSAPTAACRPAATCSSPPSSAPRSSRSGPRRSSPSAATWPASAISTRARPGIATQREDLRAKFAGTPDAVVRYFTAIAEDFRRELAAVGARSVGEIVGESRRLLTADPVARARSWRPSSARRRGRRAAARRADPAGAGREIGRAPGVRRSRSAIAAAFRGQGSVTASGPARDDRGSLVRGRR